MKKLVLLAAFALSSFIGTYAQEESTKEYESKSKAVAFMDKDGTLIKKEVYELEGENIRGLSFENIVLTDVITQEKTAAMRITTFNYTQAFRNTEEFIGTLDYDELDACIQSMEYIQNNMVNDTPSVYTECGYQSRDGLSITAFWSSKNKWRLAVKTKKYISRSQTFISIDKLPQIIEKMKSARAQISSVLSGN